MSDENNADLVAMTADVVSAYLSNNSIATADVAGLIATVHAALASTSAPAAEPAAKPEPAVSIRASVKPDHIVCLEDGKKMKMLKRYLMTNYNLTPDEYRAKWGLPRDYPMVAPDYAATRKQLAHKIGLGRKPAAAPAATKAPAKPKGIRAAKAAAAKHLGGEA